MPTIDQIENRLYFADWETYPNHSVLGLLNYATGDVLQFHPGEFHLLVDLLRRERPLLCGFNCHGFDDPITQHVIRNPNATSDDLYRLAEDIINDKSRFGRNSWGDLRGDGWTVNTIDIQKLIGEHASLKECGVKLGYAKLQELPIRPGTVLTDEEKQQIDDYNIVDLKVSQEIWRHLRPALEQRADLWQKEKEGRALWLSQPDSKLCVEILKGRYGRFEKPERDRWVVQASDVIDPRLSYETPEMQDLLKRVQAWVVDYALTIDKATGKKELTKPKYRETVTIAGNDYTAALGGIHSKDKPGRFASDDEYQILDLDVASFYPALIRGRRIVPRHLDADRFLAVYGSIVDDRLAAKRRGDKLLANALKISVNSTYGNFSYAYSPTLDPRCGLQVTLSGQLFILKVVESFALAGIEVLSTNTDGLLIRVRRDDQSYRGIIADLSAQFEVEFEETPIDLLVRRDINTYVAKLSNGEIKAKGTAFKTEFNIAKKNTRLIIKEAAIDHFLNGTDPEVMIRNCRDITKFIDYARKALIRDQHGNHHGKIARWYETNADDGLILEGIASGGDTPDARWSKLPETKRVRIVNDLPSDFPSDVNFDYYVEAARRLIAATEDDLTNPRKQRKASGNPRVSAKKQAEINQQRVETQDPDPVDHAKIQGLIREQDYLDYAAKVKNSSSYDTTIHILNRVWKRSRGTLTAGEMRHAALAIDAHVGYWEPAKVPQLVKQIDWVMATVDPMGRVATFEREVADLQVEMVDAECGAGKSYNMLREILQGDAKVVWWAIDKINPVASEREAELRQAADELGIEVPLSFLAVHSDDGERMTVLDRLQRRQDAISTIQQEAPDTLFVTLLTHRSLIDNDLSFMEGTLIIDEPVECWVAKDFKFPDTARAVREYYRPVPIQPGDYDDYEAFLTNLDGPVRLELTEAGRDFVNEADGEDSTNRALYWIADQIDRTSGRVYVEGAEWDVLGQPKDTGTGGKHAMLHVLSILHPNHVSNFDRVVMMAANFLDLYVYRIWSDLYGVRFVPHEFDGWKRVMPIRDRVRIYYGLRNRELSFNLLDRQKPAIHGMVNATKLLLGSQEYVWTANERYVDDFLFRHTIHNRDGDEIKAYLTPRANGINAYRHIHAAVWMATMKMPSRTTTLLGKAWGVETYDIVMRNTELYSAYQFVMRTSLRDFHSREPVTIVVADYVQAQYLAGMWGIRDDELLPLPWVRPEFDRSKPKGGRPKTSGLAEMTEDEKREYNKAMKQASRERKKALKTS